MNIHEFKSRWQGVQLKERSASQAHFIDLCRALGMPTPVEADPAGERYMFERGVTKTRQRSRAEKTHPHQPLQPALTWLDNAHRAVWAAYGWPDHPSETDDETILRRLLALNLERAVETRTQRIQMDDVGDVQ